MNIQLFQGSTVRVDADNLVCLTDLYKLAIERGMAEGKRAPNQYFRKTNVRKSGTSGNVSDFAGEGWDFVEHVAKSLDLHSVQVYKTTRGKGSSTFAHWQIALAYAQYLSHELHMRVNETYMRVQSGDLDLAIEIAEKEKDPEKLNLFAQRAKAIATRNSFTDTLYRHHVTSSKEIARCTNTVYLRLFNGNASQLKERKQLPKKASLRDNMDRTELAATEFAELLAIKRIEKKNAQGFAECNAHCDKAAMIIANAMREALI